MGRFKNRNIGRGNWDRLEIHDENGHEVLLKEWTGCDTFGDYIDFVTRLRAPVFTKERKKRHPQLIVCFGQDGTEELFGAKTPDGYFGTQPRKKNCRFYWQDNGGRANRTLVAVIPFPANSYGLISNEDIDYTCSQIVDLCTQEFGKNWIRGYRYPNSDSSRLISASKRAPRHQQTTSCKEPKKSKPAKPSALQKFFGRVFGSFRKK